MEEIDTKSTKSTASKKGVLRQFIDNNMSKKFDTINKKQSNVVNQDNTIQIVNDIPANPENTGKVEPEANSENTIVVTKEFTEHIIKYITYDDIIKQKDDEVKELKKKRTPHEKFITDYLTGLNEKGIDVTGGALKISTSETKTPVSKDNIKDVISKKIQDPKIIEDILNDIENSRQVKTKTNLKRCYVAEKAPPKPKKSK